MPVIPPTMKIADEADRPVERRGHHQRTAPERRRPVEDLDAGRDSDQERAQHEEAEHDDRDRRGEEVVRPHERRQEGDHDRRGGDRLVAEDRLAGEDREDLRDHPEARQDHDVDLRVAEEPEQVLPQHRRAVVGRVEPVRAEVPVGQEHRDRGGDGRQRDDQQHRVDQDRPDEQRDPAPAHARRPHVDDRHVEVDRADERGDAGEVDQEDPGILAAAGRVLDARERRIAPPAGFRRMPEQRGVEDDAARQQQPERERVEAREGHVPGADHQRHEVVAEARP